MQYDTKIRRHHMGTAANVNPLLNAHPNYGSCPINSPPPGPPRRCPNMRPLNDYKAQRHISRASCLINCPPRNGWSAYGLRVDTLGGGGYRKPPEMTGTLHQEFVAIAAWVAWGSPGTGRSSMRGPRMRGPRPQRSAVVRGVPRGRGNAW